MAVLSGLAVLLTTMPALADPCGARPDPIHMVNGRIAARTDMQRGNEKLIRYTRHVNNYVACLTREAKATQSEAKTIQRTYERQVRAFNDRMTANAGS